MAHRFTGRTSSGVWFRWATVSVFLCVSNASPGLLHCFPALVAVFLGQFLLSFDEFLGLFLEFFVCG